MRYDTLLLQRTLHFAGFDPGFLDGAPGPRTTQALMQFQKKYRLDMDGQVGPQTRGLLVKVRALQLKPLFTAVAASYGVGPLVLMAMCDVESRFGLLLDSQGKGDSGHGHGLMQIDDRSWKPLLANRLWWEDAWSVAVGAWIFKGFRDAVARNNPQAAPEQLDWGAVAGYNCGPGRIRIPDAGLETQEFWQAIDRFTWNQDHAQRVRRSWDWLQKL